MTPILRVSVTFMAYYAATGAAWPYLPIYYHELGLDLQAIGAVAALGSAVQLLTAPAWGGLADAFPRTRMTLPVAALVAALGAVILAGAHDLATVLTATVVLSVGLAGVAPVLDARAMETLGPEQARYGQVRGLGSLAFVIVAWIVGVLIDRNGVPILFVVYVPALIATAIVSAGLARNPTRRHVSIVSGGVAFVVAPGMRLFLFGLFLVWMSLTAANSFYSLRLAALGAPVQLVGLAWAIGSIVEVPLMWSYPRIAGRYGTTRPLVLGAALFAVRAAVAAVATDPAVLLIAAPIEGMAFALFVVGTVTYIAARAPSGMGSTAQGVSSAVGGLAAIAGSIVGGVVAQALTIQGLFAVCAVASAVAAGVIAAAVREGAMPAPVAIAGFQ